MKRLIAATAITLSACASESGTIATSSEYREPTQQAIQEMIQDRDPAAFTELAYAAGFFACNGVDVEIITDENRASYGIAFFGRDMPELVYDQWAESFGMAVNNYQQVTGDTATDNWWHGYREMHDLISNDLSDNCKLLYDPDVISA